MYVSIFAGTPLTPASLPERNDGRQFLKCRPRFEDSVKMEQLKSHLRADGTNVSFISHIHVRFLSCVISFIVLPTFPSPSSAVLLKVPNMGNNWGRKPHKTIIIICFLSSVVSSCTSHPCLHGGTCVDTYFLHGNRQLNSYHFDGGPEMEDYHEGSYICKCVLPYSGANCEGKRN